MRTITEFSGFVLADGIKKMKELAPAAKPAKKEAAPKAEAAPATETAPTENTEATATTEAAPAETAPAAEAAPAANDPSAALGEAFKLEGDKLAMFLAAIDVASARPQNIKRVIVMALNEGEAAPQGAVVKDGKAYLLEHFYVPQQQKKGRDDRGGKFGKGKGRGKGRGGKGRGDRDGRPGGGKPGDREARGGGRPGGPGRGGRDGGAKKPVATP